MPRVAFLGTSAFGADVLRRLVAEPGIDIVSVVTQPDRPSGRGRREQSPPVAVAARELDLHLVQTPSASSEPPDADVGAVVAFGQMVRPPLLGAYPLYNLHPSLLPRWRGAAPVERAIMAGDTETGVCVIDLTAELDAGPIHGCARFAIGAEDDAAAVRSHALELGTPLLATALRGETTGVEQPEAGVTYAHKIEAADRRIDWSGRAVDAANLVRALTPHVGARCELDGEPVTVWRARVAAGDGVPGAVSAPLIVTCGHGALQILEVQAAGRRRMAVDEYLRGLRRAPERAG
ncbi:MAG TPA: methionyl-tRNA formyltransferase [Gaiellales bacterium]|nr:methionyl-tRNA formyltransferase [Gaiellales bacterium]